MTQPQQQQGSQTYTEDVDASDLGLAPGQFPIVVTYQDREWIRDVPKFSPDHDLEAYHYVPRTDADSPLVLCVWKEE